MGRFVSFQLVTYFVRKYLRLFVGLFLLYYLVKYYYYFPFSKMSGRTTGKLSISKLPPWASKEIIQQYNNISFDSRAACRIPPLQPFHASILQVVSDELPPLVCENKQFPLLFNSTSYPVPQLVPVKTKEELEKLDISITSCCFRHLRRAPSTGTENDDTLISFTKKCYPLSVETETEVPLGWEFVMTECNYTCHTWTCALTRLLNRQKKNSPFVDLFSFSSAGNRTDIPLKEVPMKTGHEPDPGKGHPKLNVIVIALDAMSRMNFLRTLPEVHFFLKKNLSAVELEGFHKIGENTPPNIIAMLTGSKVVTRRDRFGNMEVTVECKSWDSSFDSCPFIWKDFKASGYRTLFAEDGSEMAIFNMYQTGFHDIPVDHYFRPFALAHYKYTAHEIRSMSSMCWGPRPAYKVMMDYIENNAISMHSSGTPFFQFAMTGSVTHEFINGARFLHGQLLEFLQRMNKIGVWNNTVLLLVSDHGNRIEGIRTYLQGFLEDRLPVGYIAVPPWFGVKYPTAYKNLRKNSKRLVTSYDIHKSLQDILELTGVHNSNSSSDTVKNLTSPGISLFKHIPLSRTCQDAGIPDKFCTCNMKTTPIPKDAQIVTKGVKFAVNHINNIIVKHQTQADCAPISFHRVLQADKVEVNDGMSSRKSSKSRETYRLIFETNPGRAQFEAMLKLTQKDSKDRKTSQVVATGMVGRVNQHKEQSWCAEGDKVVQPYCFCNNS